MSFSSDWPRGPAVHSCRSGAGWARVARRHTNSALGIVLVVLISISGTGGLSSGARTTAPHPGGNGTPEVGVAMIRAAESALQRGLGPAAAVVHPAAGSNWSYANANLSVSLTAQPTNGSAPLRVLMVASVNCTNCTALVASWDPGTRVAPLLGNDVSYLYAAPGAYNATFLLRYSLPSTATANISHTFPVLVGAVNGTAGAWLNITASAGTLNPSRGHEPMVYDPAIQAVVLYGGYDPVYDQALGDTWLFTKGSWVDISASVNSSPGPRYGPSMVWDPLDGYLLLFGGRDVLGDFFNDTWAFNGTTWSQINTSSAPAPRAYAALSFDAADGYVLLEGGFNLSGLSLTNPAFNDTWTYLGGVWTDVSANVTGAPPALAFQTSVYDPADREVVFFGGTSPGQCVGAALTYVYAHGGYTNLTGRQGAPPAARGGSYSMDYDPTLGMVLMFTGYIDAGGGVCMTSNETWGFSGGLWQNLTGSIVSVAPGRCCAPMTFDAATGFDIITEATPNNTRPAGVADKYDTWIFVAAPLGNGSWSPPTSGGNNSSGGSSGGGNNSSGSSNGLGNGGSPLPPLRFAGHESSSQGDAPLEVTLVATVSGGVGPYRFDWSFGDGAVGANAAQVVHTYTRVGSFTPVLSVTDSRGSRLSEVFPTIVVGGAAATTGGSGSGPALGAGISPLLLLAVAIILAPGALAAVGTTLARRRQDRLRTEGEALVEGVPEEAT